MSFRMSAVRPRDPPSLLNGCLGAVFPEVKRPGHKTDLPMTTVRKSGAIPPFPDMPSWRSQGSLYL
jgi:hypothetical protein